MWQCHGCKAQWVVAKRSPCPVCGCLRVFLVLQVDRLPAALLEVDQCTFVPVATNQLPEPSL